MSLSLITLIVVAANATTAIVAAMLFMLVLWQAPRRRANQYFALTMVLFMAYSVANGFGRFIDDLDLRATPVMYAAIWFHGLFTVSMFYFSSEYGQLRTRLARVLRLSGLVMASVQSYLLWTDQLMRHIRPTGAGNGSYQGDWTAWGVFALIVTQFYLLLAAALFYRAADSRARSFWRAPVLVVLGVLSSAVIWPVLPIPLNAVLLALAAVALGAPVLRHELFNPEAQAHAELARRSAELREASAMKNRFLTGVSYDLRTPLSSIIGYTELVLSGAYGSLNDTQRDRLTKVARNGHHLLGLINDVLDMNKIESGSVVLDLRPHPVPDLLDSVLATVEPLAAQKGLRITRAYADVPPVLVDEMRARQIVTNLVQNAIKFTHEGGVTLRARAEGAQVQLEIADTGIGIPADQHDRVFLEFEQGDGSSTRRYDGTGLGLAITRRLVELHGGHIWLESAPGQGTTFFIRLPAASSPTGGAAVASAARGA